MNKKNAKNLKPSERRALRLNPDFKSKLIPASEAQDIKLPANIRPAVLLNDDLNVMASWSAKSACTSVYVWFAYASGFGEEVFQCSSWPHDHRKLVYEKSALRKRSLEKDIGSYHFLKIIRDPYDRAVSSYRHALRSKLCDPIFAGERHPLGLTTASGFSFVQFLELLERINIWESDVHLRPQFHPVERKTSPEYLVNVSKEDLFAELNKFERKVGLSETDFKSIDHLHSMEGKRKAEQKELEGGNLEDLPLTFKEVSTEGKFPSYAQLLSARTRRKIEQIYAIDFMSYEKSL